MRPGDTSVAGLAYHGGNLGAAALAYPDAEQPWIDLSTGINAQGYRVGALDSAIFARLPEPADLAALEALAGLAYGAPPTAAIVAAPGTQALIQILPRLLAASRIGILGFTYAEHENVWRAAGAAVTIVEDVEALAGFDVAILVNPNNPDGRHVAPECLATLAARQAQRGRWLVVDEAFTDVLPRSMSLVPSLPRRGCIVLRSFGKAYGLAGLRLGFAVTAPAMTAAIRADLGPWAVSGPAIAVGRRALADAAWLDGTILRLSEASLRLDGLLASAGFDLIGGTALFRLAGRAGARSCFEHLACAGILVRPFAERPAWLRFGLPAGEAQWERLTRALRLE